MNRLDVEFSVRVRFAEAVSSAIAAVEFERADQWDGLEPIALLGFLCARFDLRYVAPATERALRVLIARGES